VHNVDVLFWGHTGFEKVESIFDLLFQDLANDGVRLFTEAIQSGSDGGFVGEVSTDSTFVFLSGSADECGVEDESVFWGVSFLLQGSEKRFFGSEDLDSGIKLGKWISVANDRCARASTWSFLHIFGQKIEI